MTTYLLDTNIIIDALNGKRGRDVLLEDLVANGAMLACCAINISEVYSGMRAKEEDRTEQMLRDLEYFEITWDVAKLAGLLRRDYAQKGINLLIPDTIIAAVAIVNKLTLITDNLKHFPMPELKLYPLQGKVASSIAN